MADKKPKSNYEAGDIYVLEGLDPVRKRPGMYIGSTGAEGLHHLIWEVADNSIDEAMAGYADEIKIALLSDNQVRIEDNGRGIPVEKHKQTKKSALETVMTTLHAGGKFGGESYKVAGGLHGVGVSVVNALSDYLKAEVCREGALYVQEYSRGKPKAKIKKAGSCKDSGTAITFEPDSEVFSELTFNWKKILDHLRQQAYLTKNVRIRILDQREEGKERSHEFLFDGGIVSYVRFINHGETPKHPKIFYVEVEKEGLMVEAALQYTEDLQGNTITFANNIHTVEGGMHLTGFKTALTRTLNDYARKNGFLKESDENLTGDDVQEGLSAVVNVKLREPQFEGQTKAKLGNPEARSAVDAAVSEALADFLERNPNDARGILEKVILAAKARKAAKAARETVIRKGALEGMTLPGKLADCSSKDPSQSEIFIVEGDSAGGCFSGNTKIVLVDGREVTFKNLVREDRKGKQNYCYTIMPDGSVGVGKIKHPRKTRSKVKVIRVTLDNGEGIICTPDHLFMLRDGTYKPARNLIPEDSLMPLHRQVSRKGGLTTIDGYEMVFDPASYKWIFAHLLADEYNIRRGAYSKNHGAHRHHIDFDKRNNSPDNLIRLTKEEHHKLHIQNAKKTLQRPDVLLKLRKLRKTMQFRKKMKEAMLRSQTRRLLSRQAKKQWENSEYKKFMKRKFLEFYRTNELYRQESMKRLAEAQKRYCQSRANRAVQSERTRQFFRLYPGRKKELSDLAQKQRQDSSLRKWRSDKTKEQWTDSFRKKRKATYNRTYLSKALGVLYQILKNYGYISVKEYNRIRRETKDKSLIRYDTVCNRFFGGDEIKLREAAKKYNHRIRKIEWLDAKQDVYDLEVDGTHNFALSSGIFVHNSAKSGRDRRFQAILPIRGKILNVEKARLDRMLGSKEIRSLVIALGSAIAEEFDLAKLRYNRIILMTDADVDGAHIRTLLLTLFYRYFPQIIEAGYLYIAEPPLYRIQKGKEVHYAHTEAERKDILSEFIKKAPSSKKSNKEEEGTDEAETDKREPGAEETGLEVDRAMADEAGREDKVSGVSIQRYKGLGEMNPSQLWETTMDPENRVLRQVNVEDTREADKLFDILMGTEVVPRKRFIQTHAKMVKNLDI